MVVATAIPPPPPSSPPPDAARIRRRLIRNLPRPLLKKKIRQAERLSEAGDRELAFYLHDLNVRKVYRPCPSFLAFIRTETGLRERRAMELERIGRALEQLPAIDEAFARGEIYWTSVRAFRAYPNRPFHLRPAARAGCFAVPPAAIFSIISPRRPVSPAALSLGLD